MSDSMKKGGGECQLKREIAANTHHSKKKKAMQP